MVREDFGRPELKRSGNSYCYIQVAEQLAALIAGGDHPPGTSLPPERDMALHYAVSTNTVRLALDELRRRNLVETVPFKGTFVREDVEPALLRELPSGLADPNNSDGHTCYRCGKTADLYSLDLNDKLWWTCTDHHGRLMQELLRGRRHHGAYR
ncbi:winged helix-turn-helix domain-containing protein [Amycolatopsis pithecellobii]|uniref:GntR family transcriptional regulator n=1 Tax=Amycolatopsis pithecellobii TaxID=664692 RepID=A0A6N7Z629_9PSEU|nr:winged helix-turn-helix domain-containing protein [Amycolatopsis pithecellobii]MTD56130.1 GntR family transcriptional regulator [Amycolatopsis pithecellobii]